MRSFNEFQRLLKQHGIDGPMAIVLTEMYEFMSALNKDQDEHLKVTISLANTVSGFVSLNEAQDGRIKQLNQIVSGRDGSAMVQSESMRDDDEGH